ncbi:MAG: DUF4190 domain-containing protein [Oscillospiraceae bacterium]|nr:DUF4190 domain-containing protein [Oscillospiraceae bacterium]
MYNNFNQNDNGQNQQNDGEQNKQPTFMINPHNGKPFDPNNIYDTNNPFSPLYQKYQQPGKGFAITSLVLGICSFFLMFFPVLGLIVPFLGIIFASIAPGKGCRGGIQTAGLVLSIIGMILAVLVTIAFITHSGTYTYWDFNF